MSESSGRCAIGSTPPPRRAPTSRVFSNARTCSLKLPRIGSGAVISTGIGSSEVMGRELEVGAMTLGMVEYDDGLIVMALLGEDAIVAVVADLNANLGNVRFQIKKRLKAIEKAL